MPESAVTLLWLCSSVVATSVEATAALVDSAAKVCASPFCVLLPSVEAAATSPSSAANAASVLVPVPFSASSEPNSNVAVLVLVLPATSITCARTSVVSESPNPGSESSCGVKTAPKRPSASVVVTTVGPGLPFGSSKVSRTVDPCAALAVPPVTDSPVSSEVTTLNTGSTPTSGVLCDSAVKPRLAEAVLPPASVTVTDSVWLPSLIALSAEEGRLTFQVPLLPILPV